MNLAIVHYHLRPGGVTRVISRLVPALANHNIRAVVLCGEPPPEPLPGVEVRVVEGLSYEAEIPADLTLDTLLEQLQQAASDVLGASPDVWNVHNHSLGKNRLVPQLVQHLAEAGQPLFLQPHDFAEDGRPDNYRLLREHDCLPHLYPLGEHIVYGTLNGRDAGYLEAAGMPAERIHITGNPVVIEHDEEASPAAREGRLYVYPTRAIRRKNIGELLWLSLFARPGDTFAVTLAPDNPVWLPIYQQWVELAEELELPVLFEASDAYDGGYPALLRDADAIVTTSVAEGFGLAFLEPWLIGKPLLGRDLPDITRDFTQAGLDLDALYTFCGVPLHWLGEDRLTRKLDAALQDAYDAYDQPIVDQATERALGAIRRQELVDFGHLDEDLQQDAIRYLKAHPATAANPACQPADDATIEQNRQLAAQRYTPERYAALTAQALRQAANATDRQAQALDPVILLSQFLQPERFCLLRT